MMKLIEENMQWFFKDFGFQLGLDLHLELSNSNHNLITIILEPFRAKNTKS